MSAEVARCGEILAVRAAVCDKPAKYQIVAAQSVYRQRMPYLCGFHASRWRTVHGELERLP